MAKKLRPEAVAIEEQALTKRQGGRPPNPLPMKSIARALMTTEQTLDEKGPEAVDMPLTGHKLAIISAIVMERAFLSDEFPLSQKVDWALRINGLLNQMKTGFVKKGKTAYPKTIEEMQQEESRRRAKIELLTSFIKQRQLPPEAATLAVDAIDSEGDEDDIDVEEV